MGRIVRRSERAKTTDFSRVGWAFLPDSGGDVQECPYTRAQNRSVFARFRVFAPSSFRDYPIMLLACPLSRLFSSLQFVDRPAKRQQPAEQSGKLVQGDHVRSVAGRGLGLGMGFKEQSVGADCHRGAGQRLDHRAVAARGGPQAARFLDAVGGVENDRRAERLHLPDCACR